MILVKLGVPEIGNNKSRDEAGNNAGDRSRNMKHRVRNTTEDLVLWSGCTGIRGRRYAFCTGGAGIIFSGGESDMLDMAKNLFVDEQGQGMTEYALIIALVAVGIITLLLAFRGQIKNVFTNATTALTDAQDPTK